MKYRLIMAALLLSWPALAQEAVVPADAPAVAPAVDTPIAAPPPEVALPSVEVAAPAVEPPVVDMSPPAVAPDIPVEIPTPDIGASVATPDAGIAPVIETPAVDTSIAGPETVLPSLEAGPTVEAPLADASPPAMPPAIEPLPMDTGLKTAGTLEYSGEHGDHEGTPETPQAEITIDTTAIGKGGDATSVLKNDITSVNINKDGDVSNTNILKPEIETTNIVKPVQETTVINDNKDVNINDVYTKTITNVEVKPTVVVQGSVAPKQSAVSELVGPAAMIVGAILLSNRGGDRGRGCGDDCGSHDKYAAYRLMCRDNGMVWVPDARPMCQPRHAGRMK